MYHFEFKLNSNFFTINKLYIATQEIIERQLNARGSHLVESEEDKCMQS